MNLKTIKTKFTLYIQLFALVLGVASFVPQRSDALLILLIIDHNSCWVNLIWGCDGGDGGGGGGGGNVTYTYESDYPGGGSSTSGGGATASTDPEGKPITRMTDTRDSLKDPCTTGDTCPGDDLGVLAGKISVNPAYASAQTDTCPLLWTQGGDDTNSTVVCNLVTNGTSQVLPKSASGKNTFNVPIGRHVLSCTRTTSETVTKYGTKEGETTKTAVDSQTNTWSSTEEHNIRCLARPNVNEI
ncbi:MAG: hypothetical protein K9M11_00585 [Candidatus Pacebacteria bacterium]|nr:hypothetical protein [Candidatus Paceibacterota bacterium]